MNSGKFFFENGNVKKKPLGFINRILTGVRWSGRSFQQPDDLLRKARIHVAKDFPNTGREDCPARSMLGAIIESQELPSDHVREHLLMCSECFTYYREKMARRRAAKPGELKAGIRTPKWAPILAGSLATVLLTTLVFLVINNRSEGTAEKANLNSVSTNETPVSEAHDSNARSAMPEQSPRIASQPETPLDRNNARSLVVENRVTIDFEAYNSLRSAGPSKLPPIQLRRTQNQLTIKLPAASPPGRYGVNLANPYGGTVQSVEAISRDGTQLRLKLNLSSVKPGDYLICLSRESEVPQCIPSVVGKK